MAPLDCTCPSEPGREAPAAAGYLPMALGLVHDFNSALTLVLGQLSLLEEEGPFSQRQGEQLAGLRHAVEYAAALPGQLLALARGSAAGAGRVELRGLVLDLEPLVRARMRPGTRLVYRLADGAHAVEGDARQLRRAVLNLTSNALEAMPGGGQLVVGVQTDTAAAPTVRLTVQDTGPGVPAEVLPRLFEPLVSGRAASGGSGLGLFVTAELVRAHGGRISCDTQPGQGTCFAIELPAAPAVSPSAPRQGALVLVIDRDAAVRQLACTILELARCAPRGCATLAEARAAAEAAPGQARAVLLEDAACDDEAELARLLALAPDAGVVLLAPDQHAADQFDPARLRAVLAKPFSAGDLVAAVAAALADVTG